MAFPTQFKDRVVALTGGASGIGLATSHLLASRGASLSLADVQEEALNKTKSVIEAKYPNSKVMVTVLDVRNYAQVEAWIKSTVSQFGALHGCANLAGVIPKSIGVGLITEQDFGEWDFVLDVNLRGVMHCLRAQLAAIAQNGSIVNASSIAGLQGRERNGSYTASKHAVLGLSRTAAKEFGPLKGVRVNAICP
jgi:NAD(P)-dependent dehydrogenase (short-subunit alcohol dehydrogenase family)